MDVMDLFNRKSLKRNLISFLFYYLFTCLICVAIPFFPSLLWGIIQSTPLLQMIVVFVIALITLLSVSWMYVILTVVCILIWLNKFRQPLRLKDLIVPTLIISIIIYFIYFRFHSFGLETYTIGYDNKFMHVAQCIIWAMVYVYAFKYFFPQYFHIRDRKNIKITSQV